MNEEVQILEKEIQDLDSFNRTVDWMMLKQVMAGVLIAVPVCDIK